MRPPAACPLSSAAPPGPAGLEGEALLLVYLAAYALFRFALEFLRGDAARGMGGVFSTSQLLALVTLAAVLPLLIRHLRTYGKQPRL